MPACCSPRTPCSSAPALAGRVEGRDAIAATYVAFVAAASVERFDVTDRSLQLHGDTAVASYVFDIDYVIEGGRHEERGQEIVVLVRSDDQWLAIWRTQLPVPDTP